MRLDKHVRSNDLPVRTAGSDAGQIRAGNQPQGRQRDRIEHPASIAAPRPRGDRIAVPLAALHESKADMPKNAIDVAIGGKADMPIALRNVR